MKIGTRASALALAQSRQVARMLGDAGVAGVELVEVHTSGDKDVVRPLAEIGGMGVFTRELEEALLDSRVDLAVHSLKDLPTRLPDGLALAGVPRREDVRDVLVSRGGVPLDRLPSGARLGTSSLRRSSQILALRPDLKALEIRGNVPTRLRKLDQGEYDAIVLALAGLKRLGLADRVTEILDPERVLPAVAQGALGLETREHDPETRAAVERLVHPESQAAAIAERALLRTLGGGCRLPIGAWARMEDGRLVMDGCACSVDGRKVLRAHSSGSQEKADDLGVEVGRLLADQGAAQLLKGVSPA